MSIFIPAVTIDTEFETFESRYIYMSLAGSEKQMRKELNLIP